MNTFVRKTAWLILLTGLASNEAFAQRDSVVTPRLGPPIQKIATASAVSPEAMGVVVSVRELPGGRVLVNDVFGRRLLLLDSMMKTERIVLDSLTETPNAYGPQPGVVIPFRGDTTFFVDMQSYAMLVFDPAANLVRVRSVWRAQDVQHLFPFSMPGGASPGVDARGGRVVYRVPAQPPPQRGRAPTGMPFIPQEPDSAFIVAVDLDTRKIDTLTSVRGARSELRVRQMATGGFTVDRVIYPLPLVDDWALLPDGTVAVVRGRDYRVEYIHPDGHVTSSPKLPFEWIQMTDSAKQHVVDSVKAAQQRSNTNSFVTSMIRWVNQYGRGYPKNFKVPEGFTLNPGLPKDWILPEGVKFPPGYLYACAPGEQPKTQTPTPASGPGPSGAPAMSSMMPSCMPAPVSFSTGGTPPAPTPRPVLVASVLDLPDYRPPFSQGSVRADMEGNLWVRTNPAKPAPGGPVFDVISPEGQLVTRMQLPPGYSIVGFGQGKVVYLSTRDMAGIKVARVRLK